MKSVCLLFIVLFVISCTFGSKNSSQGVSDENLKREISEIKLKGEVLCCDSTLWGVNFVAKVGNHIIMQSQHANPLFWVYELNKNRLLEKGSFLNNGEGPFEMIYPNALYDQKRNDLLVYDFAGGLKSMYSINLDTITNLYNTATWKQLPLPEIKSCYLGPSLFMMNDSGLIILGSHFNSENLYSYIDLSKKDFYELNYKYPTNDGTFKMPPVVKQSVYMDATISKHPFLDKFVYACGSGRYAEIINYTDSTLQSSISLFNIYPQYTTKDGLNRSYNNDCLRGMQVKTTENAIYILQLPLTKEDVRNQVQYKGYPNYYNDELFVFDWEGCLIKKYILDTPIYSYIIDENTHKLYGLTTNSENDEPVIMSYTLN